MAYWNGGEGEYPGDLYYANNASFQPTYCNYSYSNEWCNQQPTEFQNYYQGYAPSSNYSGNEMYNSNGGETSGAPSDFPDSETRQYHSTGAVPKQNNRHGHSGSSKTGAARLYRNSHSDRSNHNNDRSYRGGNNSRGAGHLNNSKAEDKKKLLAEVAHLLAPQSSSQNQAPQQTSSQNNFYPQNQSYQGQQQNYYKKGGGRNRGQNGGRQYNNRGQGNQQQSWNSGRGWAATQNNPTNHPKPSGKGNRGRGTNHVVSRDFSKEPESQRERLAEQLTRGKLECLVCFEQLRQTDAVWSCRKCYHVLHLKCTSKWALTQTSKKAGTGVTMSSELSWRCPACQNTCNTLPSVYTCFCGGVTNPTWVKGETPHCCGDLCCRKRDTCDHLCTLLCHPGPCPPCNASVVKECGCGSSKQTVICSSAIELKCGNICNKMLSCKKHYCQEECHSGPCDNCKETNTVECYCGALSGVRPCNHNAVFSCFKTCDRLRSCGLHKCERICHAGPCGPCTNDISLYRTCHCGRKPSERESCNEEVPSCGEPCPIPRPLCDHPCSEKCHRDACPPCQIIVKTPCRCGHSQMNAFCQNVMIGQLPLCRKKCTKKRQCGRHKCNTECCALVSHTCDLICNKTLSCGQHKCDKPCHAGLCSPCQRLTFDEMRCECGQTVLYPPIDCGVRLPECSGPCPRTHSCSHFPTHPCHTRPECPPCPVLVSRECYGGHETRKAVPCYIAEYSCGLACSKPLPCGHKCQERCHGGDCPSSCTQPCPKPRSFCQHPCAAPCHDGSSCPPAAACPAPLTISCLCGRRTSHTTCSEYWQTYSKALAAADAVSTIASSGGAVSETSNTITTGPPKINLRVLECDAECKLQERNLKLAIGLQIVNPDLSNKLKPQYSDAMKAWAKKDPRFCEMVHNKLTQLVTLAKESKQKSRSYSFEVMSSSKRALVHEYCRHFGCTSAAFDAEPKRNVIATAYKDKCWLPSYSLVEMVERKGQRKAPGPLNTLLEPLSSDSNSSKDMVPLTRTPAQAQPPTAPIIDYFDMTPTTST